MLTKIFHLDQLLMSNTLHEHEHELLLTKNTENAIMLISKLSLQIST